MRKSAVIPDKWNSYLAFRITIFAKLLIFPLNILKCESRIMSDSTRLQNILKDFSTQLNAQQSQCITA